MKILLFHNRELTARHGYLQFKKYTLRQLNHTFIQIVLHSALFYGTVKQTRWWVLVLISNGTVDNSKKVSSSDPLEFLKIFLSISLIVAIISHQFLEVVQQAWSQ